MTALSRAGFEGREKMTTIEADTWECVFCGLPLTDSKTAKIHADGELLRCCRDVKDCARRRKIIKDRHGKIASQKTVCVCSVFDYDSIEINIGRLNLILNNEDAAGLRDALHRCLSKKDHPIGAARMSRSIDRRNLRRQR
jgi:hypothetical protein